MARRVLYVNHVGAVSGAEESLLTLLAHLDRQRYEPWLACPAGPLAERARRLDVVWRDLPCGRVYRRGAALACLPAALLRRRPLFWHARDLRLPRAAVALVAPRAAGVIAISRAVAESLRGAGVPPAGLTVIPNAVDPARLLPRRSPVEVRAELGVPADAVLAVVVGQLVPWKCQDVLLEAVALLAPDHPRLHLAVIGADLFDDHPAYVAALAARAKQDDLRGRVHFTGHRTDVPDLLAAADLSVLPSDGEPFGRVVIEAMAAGLPVVATAPGGPAEIVMPGRTGLLVPPRRPEALARAIRFVVSLPVAERAAMGRAGQRRVARRYAPAAHAAAVQAFYQQLL